MHTNPNGRPIDDRDTMESGTTIDGPSVKDAMETASEAATAVEGSVRRKAGDVLHGVQHRAERVSDAVRQTVSSASKYVKTSEPTDMWADVKDLARRNPGASMLAVAVLGFAIGRSSSRNRAQ